MTKYFKEGGIWHRITIVQDECPPDPRQKFDNFTTMMIWWNRYRLGDKNEYNTPREFLEDLIRHNISEDDLLHFAKSGEAQNHMKVAYNKTSELYELWGDATCWWKDGQPVEFLKVAETAPERSLIDDIIENLTYEDGWRLLEDLGDIVQMPIDMSIYAYEHGSVTIRTSPCGDPWDSGQAGWIICSKEQAAKAGHTGNDWKEKAYAMMQADVKEYDIYLKGDVYGYRIERLAEGCWEDVDSCYGYFSEKWGDDLAKELAIEAGYVDVEMIDEGHEEIAV